MVRTDEDWMPTASAVSCVVRKDEPGAARNRATLLQRLQVVVECNAPKRNHYLQVCEQFKFGEKKRPAGPYLSPIRLVIRRSTVCGRGDVCVQQCQSVVGSATGRLRPKSGRVQNPVKQVS